MSALRSRWRAIVGNTPTLLAADMASRCASRKDGLRCTEKSSSHSVHRYSRSGRWTDEEADGYVAPVEPETPAAPPAPAPVTASGIAPALVLEEEEEVDDDDEEEDEEPAPQTKKAKKAAAKKAAKADDDAE